MKRRRTNQSVERNVDNKKRSSVTHLEDLSNELIYEIFDYIDYCLIHDIFVDLNSRFPSLLFHSSLPLNINFPLTSKPIYQQRCKQIITPNLKRIISLNISEHFLQRFSLDLFSSLESLIVHQIQSDKIPTLLTHLISLPRFTSLSIHSRNYFEDENSLYLAIFRLIKLKFCQIIFPSGGERLPLPLAINPSQTLERLIIHGHCRLDQLGSILSYLPALQHLSCQYLYGSECTEIKIPMNLTSIGFTIGHLSFNHLKIFLSKVSSRLKTLRIKNPNDDTYFHAKRWEELILNSMPCLSTFDLQYSASTNDGYYMLIKRFSSAFWIGRKWFFDYYYYESDDDSWHLNFFSVVPYRHNQFILHGLPNNNRPKSYENNHINFARHLTLEGGVRANKCSIRFPRVTQLTLSKDNVEENHSLIDNIRSLVPVLQITALSIRDNYFSSKKLFPILRLLPNLQSLTLSHPPSLKRHRTDTTDLSFMSDRITKVIIDEDQCHLQHVEFLIHAFPRLEYLEISINEDNLEEILPVLLSKSTCLFSLFLLNINYDTIVKIQRFITHEKLLIDYFIERIEGGLYLWW